MPVRMECAPAFNYARDAHATSIVPDDSIPDVSSTSDNQSTSEPGQKKVLFRSESLTLDLRYVAECAVADDTAGCGTGPAQPATSEPGVSLGLATRPPSVELKRLDLAGRGHLGEGVYCDLVLEEGQAVTFVLRIPPDNAPPKHGKPSQAQADALGVPIQSLSSVLFSLRGVRLPADDDFVCRLDTRRFEIEAEG